MVAVQMVQAFRISPSRVRARDAYKQGTCTTCTKAGFYNQSARVLPTLIPYGR